MGEFVSVADFGASGDGSDQSAEVQAAYDWLSAHGGGILWFPPGIYKIELSMDSAGIHLMGAGNNNCVLRPATTDGPTILYVYKGGWDIIKISGFSIGSALGNHGIGVQFGHDDVRTDDGDIGRVVIEDVSFLNLEKHIARLAGNIGVWVRSCSFEAADYHIWTMAKATSPVQHAGILFVQESSLRGAAKAVFYIDGQSVPGAGQIVVRDNVIQGNPGFVWFVKDFLGREGVPSILSDTCWDEANYSVTTVNIEGVDYAPCYARLSNVALMRAVDTPVGPVVLAGSALETDNCPLDFLTVSADGSSYLSHRQARVFTVSPPGLVESVGALQPGATYPGFICMPCPVSITKAFGSALLQSKDGSATINFVGTSFRDSVDAVGDAVLPSLAKSQDIIINASETEYPGAIAFSAGKWAVATLICKLVSGPAVTLQFTGTAGISATHTIDFAEWRTLRWMRYNASALASEALELVRGAGGGASVVRVGGINILEFATRQEALNFMNSRIFAI